MQRSSAWVVPAVLATWMMTSPAMMPAAFAQDAPTESEEQEEAQPGDDAEEPDEQSGEGEDATSDDGDADDPPPPPPPPPIPPPPAFVPPPPVAPPPPEVDVTPPPVTTPAPAVAAAAGDDDEVEEMLVTGSRIRRRDLTTPAPVAVIDRQAIQASGLVTIGQILQNLPSQSNAINVQFNNGGTGSTRINLRGIGAERTLVLLNGRRFVPGGLGADGSVDLNMIPIEIIERVEVLKDGASAIYGSDAIGGVVNIITKKDFTGVEAGAYTGSSVHGGPQYQISVTAGEVTERAGFLLSFQYFQQRELYAGARDFSKSDLDFDWELGDQSTLGSSAPPEGNIIDRSGELGNGAWQALNDREDASGLWHNDPNDGWRPARFTGNSDVTDSDGERQGDFYNYQPENYLVTPSQRYSFFGQAHYDVHDKIRFYVEGLYSNRQSDQLLAPEPLFTISEGLTVSGDNVYNPFDRDFVDVRRRLVELGNRRTLQDLNTYRVVLGVEGGLPDNWGLFSTWKWDVNFNYGRTEGTESKEGNLVRSRVASAIGPSFFDGQGIARCGTPGAVVAGCVPLNLFGGAGTITQPMLDYLTYDGVARGFSEQRVLTAEIGGEIFELWDRAAGLAIGVQHRREAGGQLPDPITASGDTTGNKSEPTGGEYSETSAYVELVVPVLADLPIIKLFEVQAAARVFNFDTFGTDFTWKLGGYWRLNEEIALRGTYSQAFRAPNVAELFSGTADSFEDANDPCDTDIGRTDVADRNCRADGVPDVLSTGQSQLRTLVGGNPNLGPETANIVTAGAVWEPTFIEGLKGLTLTLDYFALGIEKAIQPVGTTVILNNCYQRGEGADRANCDQIVRDANNIIVRIDDLEQNIGQVDTAGVDMALRYQRPTAIGRIGGGFEATWLHKYNETQPDGTVVEGLNVYDIGVFPSWRFNLTGQWAKDGLSAGFNVRYFGAYQECNNNDCSAESNAESRDISANTTLDLFASYAFSNPAGYTSFQAGLNNVFDTTPPLIYNGFLANSDASTYDYLGRYFYIGVSHKL